MRRLLLPVLSIVLVLVVHSMAIAQIADGAYEWYGTFTIDLRYADGSDTCLETDLCGGTCPSSGNFCITGLNASAGVVTGPATAPYGINISDMPSCGLNISFPGDGQVNLTMGSVATSADVVTTMSTSSVDCGGSCAAGAAASPCIQGWSQPTATTSGTPGAVVTGAIPFSSTAGASGGPGCDCGVVAYGELSFTTEDASATVTNENGTNTYPPTPVTGGLTNIGGGDYSLKMVTSNAELRKTLFGFALGTDVFQSMTLDGTLCSGVGCATGCP